MNKHKTGFTIINIIIKSRTYLKKSLAKSHQLVINDIYSFWSIPAQALSSITSYRAVSQEDLGTREINRRKSFRMLVGSFSQQLSSSVSARSWKFYYSFWKAISVRTLDVCFLAAWGKWLETLFLQVKNIAIYWVRDMELF
jgi:hypothetical protein